MSMKRNGKLAIRRERYGYFFVLPFAVGFLFFFLVPLIQSVRISFGRINTMNGYEIVVEGAENYIRAFTADASYIRLLVESTKTMLINVPLILVVSFVVAMLLKREFPGKVAYRVIFFLPVILSTGLMNTIEMDDLITAILKPTAGTDTVSNVLSSSQQVFSDLLLNANISPSVTSYILYGIQNILDILNLSGIQILLFLAALQSISPSLYEASSIEGATKWEEFWKITLPMITPQLLVAAIYTIIDNFVDVNNSVMSYIYELGFTKLDYGYSMATGWIYFGVIIAVLLVFYLCIKRFIFHYEK